MVGIAVACVKLLRFGGSGNLGKFFGAFGAEGRGLPDRWIDRRCAVQFLGGKSLAGIFRIHP